MDAAIRVLIVDDQRMFREGIRSRIEHEDDIEVVGEAGSAEETLTQIQETRPDIVTLDIRLPDVSGIEVAKQIRRDWPDLKILVLTGYDFDQYVRASARVGHRRLSAKGRPSRGPDTGAEGGSGRRGSPAPEHCIQGHEDLLGDAREGTRAAG